MMEMDLENSFEIEEIQMIPVDRLELSHPLRVFGKLGQEELDSLTECIRKEGIYNPLLVRPIDETNRYQVLDGYNRLEAARRAGFRDVPCRILDGYDEQGEILRVGIVSNLSRFQMHPLDIAFWLKELVEHRVYSDQKSLARALCISAQRLSQLRGLTELPDAVLKETKKHPWNTAKDKKGESIAWTLTERHLRVIRQLNPHPDLRGAQVEITRQMMENHWTTEQVEAAVNRVLAGEAIQKGGRKRGTEMLSGTPQGIQVTKDKAGRVTIKITAGEEDEFVRKCEEAADIAGTEEFRLFARLRE